MSREIYHVTPQDGDWRVKLEGAERASGRFEDKTDAVELGAHLARDCADLGQLKIHGRDGKFQKEYTYGQDPEKYKG